MLENAAQLNLSDVHLIITMLCTHEAKEQEGLLDLCMEVKMTAKNCFGKYIRYRK